MSPADLAPPPEPPAPRANEAGAARFAWATWLVMAWFALSAAYLRGFQSAITGPVLAPVGPVPGTSVRNSAAADALVIGATVRFGGPG
jgi:hypothetical protein